MWRMEPFLFKKGIRVSVCNCSVCINDSGGTHKAVRIMNMMGDLVEGGEGGVNFSLYTLLYFHSNEYFTTSRSSIKSSATLRLT